MLFHRDYYCGNCRRQVQRVADRYEAFEERNAVVVSILPESRERTRQWHQRYDLPFPVLADPEGVAADAFDQPVRFGKMGELSDLLGRMPLTVIMARADGTLDVVHSIRGSLPFDRPDVDELLEMVDEIRDDRADEGSDDQDR